MSDSCIQFVHRNGILWLFRDGKLFERSVGLVTL